MNIFPRQKITTKEKLTVHKGEKYPDFIVSTMDYFIDNGGDNFEREEMHSLIRVSEGKIDEELYKYVINPYNTDTSKNRKFPAQLRNYDIISPVIQNFLGERSKKPDTFQVVAVNEDAPNLFLKAMHSKMTDLAKQKFINSLNELGTETGMKSKEDLPTSKDAHQSFSTSYVDDRAIKGQRSLNILKYELNLKDTMQRAFYYWLTLGRVITHKYIVRNDVKYDVINPLEMWYSKSPKSDFIEDGNWAFRGFKMNVNDILDQWRGDLNEDDIDELENLADNLGTSDVDNFDNLNTNSLLNHDSDGLIDVYHATWKSFKKIGILKYLDELNVEREQEVSEDYKLDVESGDLSIKWEWINEVWESYRIDKGIHLGYGAIEVQQDEINNSSTCKLPYNGRTWFNQTENIKSVVKDGLPFQTLYNIYHYRAEMTMARNKDKIMMMPMGVLPKEWGDDAMDNFMYYAEATGIGWIDEARPGAMAALQAIKSIDMSLSQYFGSMYEAMQAIKQEWWDSVGMNRQRFGDVKTSDGKGTTDQAIFRSSIITEELFRQFHKLEESDLNGIINYSKVAWIEGKRGSYINSEGRAEVYDIDGLQHMESQYGVFVKDQSNENEKLQMLKQMTLSFAQNGSKPSTTAEILDSENYSIVKSHLKKLDDIEQERQENEAKAERESAERIEQTKLKDNQEQREADKYKVDTEYNKAIDVKKLDMQIAIQTKVQPQTDNSLEYLKEENSNNINKEKMVNDRNAKQEDNVIKREEMASKERIARENKNQFDSKD